MVCNLLRNSLKSI
ncbi:hypothetical protein B4U80_02470 [Leptotrombidium deliense]|uniref:Uncharacterized protein n=1 Tax=Leptotrombidium deliense TaxID=299467 RepID=A0A443RZ10_9ACAR|nr:hypothetical protein B4U80_02470 [Leptotrombidium deliense]